MADLSDREWTVLEALWDSDGAELGVLSRKLRPETGWSANTLHTYLTRMEKKGLVSIDKTCSPHIYRAAVEREACRAKERKSFLDRVYQGSAGDLIAAFLKEERISPEEKEKLRRMLDDMEV
ncbi:MAG TPA: BlaI/MecI/CopY family transcriptional regulator [Candidatus Mediterraneibacter cottocaccae]|nr:BlaI/MecI/CopY family transcriptional regulator [Candidatus Mediterraneibacter cottocaccae]